MLNAKPQTLNPKPQTLNPKPQTPNPKPQTLNPKPQTLNPEPRTLNPEPRTLTPYCEDFSSSTRPGFGLAFLVASGVARDYPVLGPGFGFRDLA